MPKTDMHWGNYWSAQLLMFYDSSPLTHLSKPSSLVTCNSLRKIGNAQSSQNYLMPFYFFQLEYNNNNNITQTYILHLGLTLYSRTSEISLKNVKMMQSRFNITNNSFKSIQLKSTRWYKIICRVTVNSLPSFYHKLWESEKIVCI